MLRTKFWSLWFAWSFIQCFEWKSQKATRNEMEWQSPLANKNIPFPSLSHAFSRPFEPSLVPFHPSSALKCPLGIHGKSVVFPLPLLRSHSWIQYGALVRLREKLFLISALLFHRMLFKGNLENLCCGRVEPVWGINLAILCCEWGHSSAE